MTTRPKTLYHYTTAGGLLGILEPVRGLEGYALGVETTFVRSFSLWATDARYLNDSAELGHAGPALADAIDERISGVDNTERRELLAKLSEQVRHGDYTADDYNIGKLSHTAYVTSFCTDGNLLSQWRGYGANGGGYSIEFRADVLRDLLVPMMRAGDDVIGYASGSTLYKVDYDLSPERLQECASEIVDGESGWELYKCLSALAQFKNPAFREEDEWRVISSGGTFYVPCKFRTSPSGGIVPFIQMVRPQPVVEGEYIASAIKSIMVGPGPDQDLRREAVAQLLAQRGFFDVSVDVSATTYKG